MSNITKPIILDETGLAIVAAINANTLATTQLVEEVAALRQPSEELPVAEGVSF